MLKKTLLFIWSIVKLIIIIAVAVVLLTTLVQLVK